MSSSFITRPFSFLSLLAVLFVFGSGCASTSTQVLLPDYQTARVQDATLAVLPLASTLAPDEAAEIEGDANAVTRRGHVLYPGVFGSAVQNLVAVSVLDAADFTPAQTFVYQTFEVEGREAVRVPVPQEAGLTIGAAAPEFLLILSDLSFEYGLKEATVGIEQNPVAQPTVKASAEYVIWDNQKGQAAAFGRVSDEVRSSADNVNQGLTRTMQNLARQILKKSPFEVKDVTL